MKAPARDHRQILRLYRGIQSGQLRAQLLVMLGLDAGFGASAIKALQPGMTERLDHVAVYPDRIQYSMMWHSSSLGPLTLGGASSKRRKPLDRFGIYRRLSSPSGRFWR